MKVKVTHLKLDSAKPIYVPSYGPFDLVRASEGHKIAMLENGHFACEIRGEKFLVMHSAVVYAKWEPVEEAQPQPETRGPGRPRKEAGPSA